MSGADSDLKRRGFRDPVRVGAYPHPTGFRTAACCADPRKATLSVVTCKKGQTVSVVGKSYVIGRTIGAYSSVLPWQARAEAIVYGASALMPALSPHPKSRVVLRCSPSSRYVRPRPDRFAAAVLRLPSPLVPHN